MKPESMMTGIVGTTIAVLALTLRIAAWAKGRSRRASAA
jgi:hypothetical protein